MRLFHGNSIKRKLMGIIMFTSSVTVILACVAFAVYDVIRFRMAEVEEIRSISEIIASNSVAPLEFNDSKAGKENLEALRANSHVFLAVIYTRDEKIFAAYRVSDNLSLPDKPGIEGGYHEDGYLKFFYPIVHDKERIGTLFIQSDEEEMYSHIKLYGIIVAFVLVISLLVSYLISSRLQAMISDPILHLTETADQVAAGKDYSVRVSKHNVEENELGVLVDRFNEMLSHIQERDKALHKINAELDERVKERTRELESEIEERKKIEEKLRYSALELKRSNQDLSDFASIASHDLKEPLRKVISFGERLKAHCEAFLDDQARDYIARTESAVSRMQILIDSLLQLSRVSTKAQPFVSVDLKLVVEEVMDDLEILLKNSGGTVNIGNLPTMDADALQMRQLFQNLIANALKFRKEGVPPIVTVSSTNSDGRILEIRVEDNGIGFDQKFAERIFKPFERLHGRTHYEGSGVGLAICQKIVARHNGTINAQSELGKGTVFIITLGMT